MDKEEINKEKVENNRKKEIKKIKSSKNEESKLIAIEKKIEICKKEGKKKPDKYENSKKGIISEILK